MLPRLRLQNILLALTGSAILAFGLYHVHSLANVTEGGVLGMTLLLRHHFHISPAISSLVLDGICFFVGWRTLGTEFLCYSAFASGGFSLFYAIFERFDRIWPELANHPLAAALAGAAFVGVGAGLCVRAGGAPGGDDALAMSLSKRTGLTIQWVYLITDLTVLALSLTYIPWRRMVFSLLTTVLSGQIIGWIQKIPEKK